MPHSFLCAASPRRAVMRLHISPDHPCPTGMGNFGATIKNTLSSFQILGRFLTRLSSPPSNCAGQLLRHRMGNRVLEPADLFGFKARSPVMAASRNHAGTDKSRKAKASGRGRQNLNHPMQPIIRLPFSQGSEHRSVFDLRARTRILNAKPRRIDNPARPDALFFGRYRIRSACLPPSRHLRLHASGSSGRSPAAARRRSPPRRISDACGSREVR